MMKVIKKLARAVKNIKGATLVEYAVMLALIVVVSITAIGGLGNKVNAKIANINSSIN